MSDLWYVGTQEGVFCYTNLVLISHLTIPYVLNMILRPTTCIDQDLDSVTIPVTVTTTVDKSPDCDQFPDYLMC